MFPLLTSCSGSADGGAIWELYYEELFTGDAYKANNYREHIQEYSSATVLASVGTEIKSPSGNGQYCFRIYHLLSPLSKWGK
jgi:hypothetical protein